MSAMLFALIFPRAQRASTYDISAERNVWLQSALRSFAIVCDYMETGLFAIVCDRLRSYGNQPLLTLVSANCVSSNSGLRAPFKKALQIQDLHADDMDSNHALINSLPLASWTSQPSSVTFEIILSLLFHSFLSLIKEACLLTSLITKGTFTMTLHKPFTLVLSFFPTVFCKHCFLSWCQRKIE